MTFLKILMSEAQFLYQSEYYVLSDEELQRIIEGSQYSLVANCKA
jgi:hypothetical protein